MTAEILDQVSLRSVVTGIPQDALSGLRRHALDSFAKHGFPSTREEDWHYTSLGIAAEISNDWLQGSAGEDVPEHAASAPTDTGIDADWIVVTDGGIDRQALSLLNERLSDGVSILPLSALSSLPDLYIDDSIASFNAALLRDGILVRVAPGVSIERPIGFAILDQAHSSPAVSQVRIVIETGQGAAASFVYVDRSGGGPKRFSTSVVELLLGPDSAIDFLRLQERAESHVHTSQFRASLDAGAVLQHGAIDVGGRLVRNDVHVKLAGPRARASLCGAYFADGQQHVDNHLFADHLVGPAESRQDYRGIAAGRARCIFNGKAVVRPHAGGTDAVQSNHNLLLSENAEIDTKPELEIYADDVKCAHGATVGQLDEKSVFYLRSRGLGRDEAILLLTRAFAANVLGTLPIPAARQYVDRLVERKLDSMIGGSGA
ncbi:MAG: Fe-S cluster assembly protein SufD [Gammaproteobacteria bacterium]|nr:Fe-S cluster assembly protein SufD [Gammaproteobacteria bacterium]MDH4256264.1 Fe-S cluster assembly protein SufD [Gammaproteobacteria bacterium]MDH5310707.1 Fe-S cluster assembly protein SufD [Gammaproteobacteria bacterium]